MSVDLQSATPFALLCAAALSCTGSTVISNGAVGSKSTVSGFPPATLTNGAVIITDQAVSATAIADATTAFNTIRDGTSPAVFVPGELGGITLNPGTYYNTGAVTLATGDMVLSGDGQFVFRFGAAMSIAASTSMILTNGALAENIVFQVTGAFSIGASVKMSGTVLCYAAIAIGANCTIGGALISLTGALAVDTSSVTRPDNAAQLAAAAVVQKALIVASTSIPLNFSVEMPDASILAGTHVFGESCMQMVARITAYFIPHSVDSRWELVCNGITLATDNFIALLQSGVTCTLQKTQSWLSVPADVPFTRQIVFVSNAGTMTLVIDNRFSVRFFQRQYQMCFSSNGDQQVWIDANNQFLSPVALMSTVTAVPITVVICSPLVLKKAQLTV